MEEEKKYYQIIYSKGNLEINSSNILFISPYEIRESQVDACLKLWREASLHAEKNKGLKGVRLLKATDKANKYDLINLRAPYTREDLFIK